MRIDYRTGSFNTPLVMVFAALLATSSCSPVSDEATTAAPNAVAAEDVSTTAAHAAFQMPSQEALDSMLAAYFSKDLAQEAVREHIGTFSAWANARALQGRMTHPQVPLLISLITQPDFVRLPPKRAQLFMTHLQHFARTMLAQDREPGLFGTLTGRLLTPGRVNSFVTMEQTYTVGTRSMGPGTGFVLPNNFRFSRDEYQTTDPTAKNYVSIRSSNPKVVFVADTYTAFGQFAKSLRGQDPRLFFRIDQGVLKTGDTVTVTLGDPSGGGPGLHTIHWTNSAPKYTFWVIAHDDNGELLVGTPAQARFALEGLEAVAVKGFGPATTSVGNEIVISIRAEDTFRNLASSGFPVGYNVSANGEPLTEIPASQDSAITEFPISFSAPGVYRLQFESTDGRLRGSSDPILVEDEPGFQVYFGETHGHSGFAEGMGKIDAYFEFARDEARLDFCTLSEHDLWMDAGEWAALKEAVRRYDNPGQFTTFLGYEWTVEPPWGGHHNVLYRDPEKAVYVPRQEEPELDGFWAALSAANAIDDIIVIPHAHQPGNWLKTSPELERLVEIVSYHGTFEWFGQRYLNNGFETGLIGSSDDHVGHPGYRPAANGGFHGDNFGGLAAVYATHNDRNTLMDAMRDRRTYATNGARIILLANMDGVQMGRQLKVDANRVIEGTVHGTAPIASITLVKNGEDYREYDYTTGPNSNVLELSFQASSDPIERRRVRRAPILSGQVQIEGAEIRAVDTPVADALNTHTEGAQITGDDVISFSLKSQGRKNTIEIELADMTRDASAVISGTLHTTPEDLELAPQQFEFSTLRQGADQRPLEMDNVRFTLGAQFINRPTVMDRNFSFNDDAAAVSGDYYYLRVRQVDGGLAYSSPWWIGTPAPNQKATLQTAGD